ncbi:MAG TPA: glycosyltransferase family 4 protein [Terriglobales bacterium]|nr:glycosyltransferase family 4 protein [Terriglobales bacterium]
MPRVLLITYHFPPSPAIGSVRPMGLAKYLPQFGWEPVVLTPKLPDGPHPAVQIIETEYQDVLGLWKSRFGLDPKRGIHQQFSLPRAKTPNAVLPHTRLMKWLRPLLLFPDDTKGWTRFAMDAIARLKEQAPVDAIITTSPPITCNLIGVQAKQMLGVPWLADFRDLWTQDTLARNNGKNAIFHLLDQRLEGRILAKADALVTVSEPWVERFQEKAPKTPIHCITNGFDPEDFAFLPVPLTRSFSITYTGLLYEGKRDPSPLLEVLSELIQSGTLVRSDVVVRFYGPFEPWLQVLVGKYGLEGVVQIHDLVTRDEALRSQAESQLLLLIGWHDLRERGQHTGKLFEYLGSKRPILALGGSHGVMSEVLEETGAGVHALTKEQLRDALVKAYGAFRNTGRVPYEGQDTKVKNYTHQEMARRFALVLDGMMAQKAMPSSWTRPQVGLAVTS